MKKSSSEEIKQSGIDFLKSTGIKEVSNRTFIHEDELKKFLDSDFKGINKTKAMGFIQILEREYSIDLSDLKNSYITYLNEHAKDEEAPKQSLMMEEVKNEERKKGVFSFLFLIAAIGSIAYLINRYNLLDFSTPNDIKTAQVLDVNDVKDAKLNLEKLSQPEKPQIVDKVKKEESIVASEIKDIDENIKQLETVTDEQTNSAEEKDNNLDLSKLNSELQTDDANKDVQKDDEMATVDEANTDDNSTQEAITNEIYIIPSSKVWIGTIELDTLKKKDFLAPRGKRVDIDTSNNKLIMIGHKFVKIYLNGDLVTFKRKGPVRFKYIDGELTEINRKEFNKLAKGKQW